VGIRLRPPPGTTHPGLVQVGEADDAVLDLICIPHAAAGAARFRAWRAVLPPQIGLLALRLPGRERRLAEDPVTTLDAALDDVEAALAAHDRRIALFGLCSGAIVAYLLAHRRRDRGALPVEHLFVASQLAPRLVPATDPPPAELDTGRLLEALGGTPAELFENREFVEMTAPLVRADVAMMSTYRYEPRCPLDVPITAIAGEDDAGIDPFGLMAWSEETTVDVVTRRLPGGHLLDEVWEAVPELIAGRLAGVVR
jgi:medium-chain acyl-[acyl-carrier-protein] hydrolase